MTSAMQDIVCGIEYIEVPAAVYVSEDLAKTYASWRALRSLHSAGNLSQEGAKEQIEIHMISAKKRKGSVDSINDAAFRPLQRCWIQSAASNRFTLRTLRTT